MGTIPILGSLLIGLVLSIGVVVAWHTFMGPVYRRLGLTPPRPPWPQHLVGTRAQRLLTSARPKETDPVDSP